MLPPKQHKAYCAFYDSVRDTSILDQRTSTIVGLSAAMACGCDP